MCVNLMNILDPSIYTRLACSIWGFSQGFICGSSLEDYINIYSSHLPPFKKLGVYFSVVVLGKEHFFSYTTAPLHPLQMSD